MTDKTGVAEVNSLTVVLDHDMSEDEVIKTVNAIMTLKSVIGIKENVVNVRDYMAETRAEWSLKHKIYKKISEVIKEVIEGECNE